MTLNPLKYELNFSVTVQRPINTGPLAKVQALLNDLRNQGLK